MNVLINGYRITKDFDTRGAGMSRWGIAEKGGGKFFIKEFLQPKYPEDGSFSKEKMQYMRNECTVFFNKHKTFYDALAKSQSGNNVIIEDFFRFGTKYYITTKLVDAVNMTAKQLSELEPRDKIVLLRVIANSFDMLHTNGLVHSDVKLDNILIKKTVSGNYTAKVIDFDSGFLISNPPSKDDEIVGDAVYFAPETIQLMFGDDVRLTEKIDIFAMGIVFHQIWCGKLPKFSSEYDCVAEAVLNDENVRNMVDCSIPEKTRELIVLMLNKDPTMRPSANNAFSILSGKPVTAEPVVMEPVLKTDDTWKAPTFDN